MTPIRPSSRQIRVRLSRATAAVLGLVTFLLIASTQAAAVSHRETAISGKIQFHSADLDGVVQITSASTGAAYFSAPTPPSPTPLRLDWSLDAARVTVNWTKDAGIAIANPNNPDHALYSRVLERTTGEFSCTDCSASSAADSKNANLLVIADPALDAPTTQISSEGLWAVAPAKGEVWIAGDYDAMGVSQSNVTLKKVYQSNAGRPVLQSSAEIHMEVVGNFSVWVWDAAITLAEADGASQEIRTGAWSEPATPVGVVEYRYWQLVELRVSEGAFRLAANSGEGRLESVSADVKLSGAATFEAGRAYLESADYAYSADGGRFAIEGDIAQRIEPSPVTADELVAALEAEGATTTLLPSGAPPASAGDGAREPSSGGAGVLGLGSSNFVDVGSQLTTWIWAAVVILMVVGLAFLLWQRRGSLRFAPLLASAEIDLMEGRYRNALTRAREASRLDSSRPEPVFAQAVALLKLGKPSEALKVLDSRGGAEDPDGLLALMRSLALLHCGRERVAGRALQEAIRINPALRWEIRGTDLFERLGRFLRPDPVRGAHGVNTGYV